MNVPSPLSVTSVGLFDGAGWGVTGSLSLLPHDAARIIAAIRGRNFNTDFFILFPPFLPVGAIVDGVYCG